LFLQVFCTGRNKQKLQELGFPYHAADLTDEGACQAVVDNAVKTLGGLTTLVRFSTTDTSLGMIEVCMSKTMAVIIYFSKSCGISCRSTVLAFSPLVPWVLKNATVSFLHTSTCNRMRA
jgi:hypothetical protein